MRVIDKEHVASLEDIEFRLESTSSKGLRTTRSQISSILARRFWID